MHTIDCDYLVIGSGLSGIMAAWHLRGHGHVVLATKEAPDQSNSDYAQGGIACAVSALDSIEEHVRDTLGTGAGLCDERHVRAILSRHEWVRRLEEMGVAFARREGVESDYDLGKEGGHSRRRVLHAGDITGHEIMKVLHRCVAEDGTIEVLRDTMAIDLVTTGWLRRERDSRCIGAYFLDRTRGEVVAIRAPYTILATGGAGKVYLYTSNPDVATGDGVAMAWRAGLPILDMEMIQFHPTCLFHPRAKSFLISEAVRGEGAELINKAGEAFMKRYDPRGALAPRDVVTRAIDREMKTHGDTCVYLDITHKSKAFLTERFPNIYKACLEYGFDMATEPVPVVPAAHYICGGVEADENGVTALPGLYAVGEVSCTGLHGANRLASNSLLEAVVCGGNAAEHIVRSGHAGQAEVRGITIPDWEQGDAVPSDEAVVVEHNWNEVRTCMWDYVGIVRTNKRLARAARRLAVLRQEIRQYYLAYLITPDTLELRNLAAVAELITRSAFMRHESRGLHYTLDYPDMLPGKSEHSRICDRPGGPMFPLLDLQNY
ncbi:MAG: L-aspartate oxidase [Kiritimatiellae bacterium]|nr:L-aspartate oxidase [Kiritimatiellia bacterium]